jgi:PKD repeat protein
MKKIFWVVLILSNSVYSYSQYQWPFPNPSQQALVFGSVGEYRDTGTPRFHQGVDLSNGTNYAVHAINSGTVDTNGLTGALGVITVTSSDGTEISYIHTDALPGIGRTITTVSIGDQIGTMGVQTNIHLHLESDNINFLDHNLNPYVDNAPPYFSSTTIPNGVAFYRNGLLKTTTNAATLLLNSTVNITGNDHAIIYSKVDIVAHVIDPRTNSNGSGGGGQLAPTNTAWKIKNSANTQLFNDQLNFTGVPNNAAASVSFHPSSAHPGSPSIHILTSHPRDTPYDRFFNTRLRIDQTESWDVSPSRSTTLDARYNGEAQYPDGKYTFEFVANDVDHGANPKNSTAVREVRTVVDNFRPYIKEVEIRKNTYLGPIVYRGVWNWNNGQLTLKKDPLYSLGSTDKVWIKITASEPVENLRINIPLADGSSFSNAAIPATTPYISIETVANKNNTEFIFIRNAIAVANDQTINILAEDLAGNPLQSVPSQIPICQADGTWSAGVSSGMDNTHQFKTGTGTCTSPGFPGGRQDTGIAANATSPSGCMYVDFTPSKANPGIREAVTFTPVVSGSGLITYLWDFGSGAIPATSTSSGTQTVIYTTAGTKTISLKICDATTSCITEQKVGAINVGASSVSQLAVDFSASQLAANTGQTIQLTSTVTGAVGSVNYSWHFDSGVTQGYVTAANPLIAYNTTGNKTISLTVTDANGSVTKVKNSYLFINSFLWKLDPQIFGGCLTTGADGATSFSAVVTGGSGPPYSRYQWDFGDGKGSTEATPLHTYTRSGKYTVRLTVCDATSCGTTESVNCVTVPDIVDARTLSVNFRVDNKDFPKDIGAYRSVVVGINTPVTFTDATTGGGDPATFTYKWDFDYHSTSTSVPTSAETRGPHEVYFTQEGYFDSDLFVYNPVTFDRKATTGVEVRKGLGSGRCYANIGVPTISSSCWSPTNFPRFAVPVTKTNCPIAKTEIIYWHSTGGIVLPNNVLDFAAMNVPIPQFPHTADFSFTVSQYDGINYNNIGYKRRTFTINGPPSADAGPDKKVCLGSTTTLGTTSSSNLTYQWTSADADAMSFINLATSPTPTFLATQKGTFTYSLKTTDKLTGCSSTIDKVIVTVNKPEVAPLSLTLRLNETSALSPVVTGGFGGNTYSWSPATKLSSSTAANPSFVSGTDANDNYQITVTDQNGCKGIGEVYLNVSDAAGAVKGEAASYQRIVITWIDRSDNETGYLIQRSVGGNANFTDYATVGANITSFEDANIQKDITYFYKVITLFASGNKSTFDFPVTAGSLPLFSYKPLVNNPPLYPNFDISSRFAWRIIADFDSDGDLDSFQNEPGTNGLTFYKNEIFNFSAFKSVSPRTSSYNRHDFAEAIDFDNDNDVDILVSLNEDFIYLFKNINQTSFEIIDLSLKGDNRSEYGSINFAVADFDNDGSQDIMLPVHFGDIRYNLNDDLILFRNSKMGPLFFTNDHSNLVKPNLHFFSRGGFDHGDIDNDHRIDAVFNGFGQQVILKNLYPQMEFEVTNMDKVWPSNFAVPLIDLGDMDADGDLDLMVSGDSQDGCHVYKNENGHFSDLFKLPLTSIYWSWVDFENDGDLDLLTYAGVYINNLGSNKYKPNTRPQSPSNLCSYLNGNSLTMSWSRAFDSETPSPGLGYNVYVKQNGAFIMSPMADLATGYRKVAQRGNVDHNTSWTITLPSGSGQIEWGVQAIDTQYIGSPFANSSATFIIDPTLPDITLCGTYGGNVNYFAPNIVSCSPGSTLILGGASVNLTASKTVRMLPGFVVQPGATLNAKISGATSPCVSLPSGRVDTDVTLELKKDEEEVSEIMLYPNPTTGILNIEALFGESRRIVTVQVSNLTGSVLFTKQYNNVGEIKDQIDLSSFSQGVYIVNIQDDTGVTIRKILKL